jgi:NAD(P)-dependent dehydrogenase (short-subunit alcohol dehydrogenase family)
LTEIGGIPAIIDKAVARYGRLDCAFNNAGVSGGGPIETLDEQQWNRADGGGGRISRT